MGKIPLTNAELFKALLLNTDNIPFEKTTEQIGEYERAKNQLEKIAFEWDYIEQSLRDDDFWYFISNDYKESETRIDYLLKLKAKQLKSSNAITDVIYETDSLFSFLVINSYLKKSSSADDLVANFENHIKLWKDIVKLHDMAIIPYGLILAKPSSLKVEKDTLIGVVCCVKNPHLMFLNICFMIFTVA